MSSPSTTTTICPYCARPLSPYSGRLDCPHCTRAVFSVACPKCARPTLNLTLIPRYGSVRCFACRFELQQLPEESTEPLPHPALPVENPAPTPLRPRSAAGGRGMTTPLVPSLEDTRSVMEQCLVGLERVVMDREMLRTPDLRAIAMRYLDLLQEALMLDTAMTAGEVTASWLRDTEHLRQVARVCYLPLWLLEGTLLPPAVQVWALAVDDAARRWQYLRRVWFAEQCGLTLMPTVPCITTTNPGWQEIAGDGKVVLETLSPGFLLQGEVVRKARVRA